MIFETFSIAELKLVERKDYLGLTARNFDGSLPHNRISLKALLLLQFHSKTLLSLSIKQCNSG